MFTFAGGSFNVNFLYNTSLGKGSFPMVMTYLFVAFFVIAFIIALVKLVFLHDANTFTLMVQSTFDMSKTGFEISIGITGALALWLGLMKVAEDAGVVALFSRLVGPFFERLFPEIPKGHPAFGSIIMNFAANMLGLDNAATPLGLKAMKEMQELNVAKDTASNPQIMFLVLNTSGLTLIPVSILALRSQAGAANPSDVFLPILMTTFFSTLVGLITVALLQKVSLFNRVILAYLGGISALILLMLYWFQKLPQDQISSLSSAISSIFLMGIILWFLLQGLYKKINVYESFVDGAKEGFIVAIRIIPFLIAVLVAIGVFRASGAMDMGVQLIAKLLVLCGLNTDFVGALPTAFMKPLSGSGARGMMVEAMTNYGPDSFPGRLACVFQGSTDTTFYVLALYFGSVRISKIRYALSCGLIADGAGIIAAIFLSYLFFH